MHKGSVVKGAMLVAGTSIGGGMLALPIATGLGGLIPSLLIFVLCWLFMAATGLIFLEISLWTKDDANIVTMAERTLGTFGKVAAWILYLFLFYSLTIAYMTWSGNFFCRLIGPECSYVVSTLLFVAVTAPMVYVGTRLIGGINLYLMIGLAVCYVTFIIIGVPHLSPSLWSHVEWSRSLIGLPIAFTSFAYQGTIPTLSRYMHYQAPALRKAIIIGSFLPFLAYALWQILILGIIPVEGLETSLAAGEDAVQPLKRMLNIPWVYAVGEGFAFFAVITSYLGVTLGMRDFLADGLRVIKTGANKWWICLLVFIPPLIIALSYPNIFIKALELAGGYGCALLLGLLPILMVWSGRYYQNRQGDYRFFGGRPVLLLLIAFIIFEIGCSYAFFRFN